MLRAIVIAPDPDIRQRLQACAAEAGVVVQRMLDRYPDADELSGFLLSYRPQLLLVDIASDFRLAGQAVETSRGFGAVMPVALHREPAAQVLLELMRRGWRDCWVYPFEPPAMREAVARLAGLARKQGTAERAPADVYTFLPARPGCGASHLAAQMALGRARSSLGRTLLLDFDLDHGLAGFLLRAASTHTVWEALEYVAQMDDDLWSSIVTPLRNLDLLPSAVASERRTVEAARARRLFDFVRGRYETVLADTSGDLGPANLELIGQSRRVFLVCTQELTAVHLAREKLRHLRAAGLDDRVSLVVNRWQKSASLSLADLEKCLGLPVEYTIPESPKEFYTALLKGGEVAASGALGKELANWLKDLGGARAPAPRTERKRLVEYFALVPGRHVVQQTGH